MKPEDNSNSNLSEAEKPKTKQTWIKSKTARIILSVLILGVLSVFVAFELGSRGIVNIPGIQRNIYAPPSFDNKADEQVIKAGTNTTFVSTNQLPDLAMGSIKPAIKGQFPDVSVILPVELSDGQDISVSTFKGPGANWITKEGDSALALGKIINIPTKGTKIIIPVEGAEVFKFHDVAEKDGTPDFNGFVLRFSGPDQVQYEMIYGTLNTRDTVSLPALDDAPFIGDEDGYFSYFEGTTLLSQVKGLPIPEGTSVAVTNQKNAIIDVLLITLATNVSNLNVDSGSVVPSNFSLITLTDNSGNQKVAVLPSN